MLESLDRPFTPIEVHNALWKMHPNKSPGSAGFSPLFFQKYWDIVGNSVSSLSLCILNEGLDVSCINQTLITLIPKVDNPTLFFQFRPISLCNVIYKMVAKCLSIRLKQVTKEIISETQSVFVGGVRYLIMLC